MCLQPQDEQQIEHLGARGGPHYYPVTHIFFLSALTPGEQTDTITQNHNYCQELRGTSTKMKWMLKTKTVVYGILNGMLL